MHAQMYEFMKQDFFVINLHETNTIKYGMKQ